MLTCKKLLGPAGRIPFKKFTKLDNVIKSIFRRPWQARNRFTFSATKARTAPRAARPLCITNVE